MEININKGVLVEAVKKVARAIKGVQVIPALSGVHIMANQEGLTLTGSDSELSIRAFISASEPNDLEVIEEGSIILPARELSNITKAMPEDKIKIKQNQLKVKISSGKANFVLNGMDGNEYPNLPKIDGESFTVKADKLKSLINKTIYAVSKMETRPILTGINFFIDEDNKLGVVATDSHRLSKVVGIEFTGNQLEETVTLPAKALKEIPSIIGDSEEITVQHKNSQMLFKTEDVFVLTRVLDGNFPETNRLIPTDYKTLLKVDRKSFLASIERSAILSENSVVKFKISDKNSGIFQTIELSQNFSELGKSKEDIIVDSIEGDEVTLSFDSNYMIDALKRIDEDSILIEFNGAMRPFVIKPENRTDFIQLILPVRTYN